MTFRSCWLSGLGLGVRPGIAQSTVNICAGFYVSAPLTSLLARHSIRANYVQNLAGF